MNVDSAGVIRRPLRARGGREAEALFAHHKLPARPGGERQHLGLQLGPPRPARLAGLFAGRCAQKKKSRRGGAEVM